MIQLLKKKKRLNNYYDHLKNFGFTWEHSPLEIKYEITLSSDEKKLTKKLQWAKQQGEN